MGRKTGHMRSSKEQPIPSFSWGLVPGGPWILRAILGLLFFSALLCACAPPHKEIAASHAIPPQNSLAVGPSSRPDVSSLRCLTYNIRLGAGIENRFTRVQHLQSSPGNLHRIAAAIRSLDPDIVALQEVEDPSQAAFMAKELGLNHVYASHGRSNLEWGLAVLTRFRVLDAESAPIYTGRLDPRVAMTVRIESPFGTITCMDLHYYPALYDLQVRNTIAILDRLKSPLILMGDLNFADLDGALEPLRERLVDAAEAVKTAGAREVLDRGTVRGLFTYRLDYVLIDPRAFRVKKVGLLPDAYRDASDHIGFFADVEPVRETSSSSPPSKPR
jgi:endonuclease/exonuclease/phosphatase family metal-dependent hydrolase